MIRAVYFDAVGTLLHPSPSAADVYAAIGRRHGSRYGVDHIRRRFRAAFARQEGVDRSLGWRTSEERERRRWREIVAEVLDDVPDAEACFQELYTHFSRAEAWRVEPAAAALLVDLRRRGLRLGLASNYDARLRTVIAGLPVLAPLEHVLISSEVGWRKPAPEFFAAVCGQVRLPPDEVLYIGDDPENDVAAAGAAGLHARLAVPGWESALTLPTN